jgi:hypothetical protein
LVHAKIEDEVTLEELAESAGLKPQATATFSTRMSAARNIRFARSTLWLKTNRCGLRPVDLRNIFYAEYAEFSERLRKLGLQEDAREGAPLCRWRQQTTTLDVMPLDENILGFSNTWYRPAMEHAEEREL